MSRAPIPLHPVIVDLRAAKQCALDQSQRHGRPYAAIPSMTLYGRGTGYAIVPCESVTDSPEVERLRARIRELEDRVEDLAAEHDYSPELRASIGRVRQ